MNTKEFFVRTVRDEIPRFVRAIEALPADRLDYRPHERSRSALELLMVVGNDLRMLNAVLEKGAAEFTEMEPAADGIMPPDVAADLKRSFEESIRLAEGATDEEWDSDAVTTAGGNETWRTARGTMAWAILLDLIHHRGQLSTYIRPMGGKVPAIYGPSADEPSA